jgi:hypothetical protein
VKAPARHYRPSLEQYLAGERLAQRRDFWIFEARVIAALAVAFAISFVLPDLEFITGTDVRKGAVVLGMTLTSYWFVDWLRFRKRVERAYAETQHDRPLLYAVRDEGIEITGSDTYGIEKWEDIDHWSEDKDSIFLFARSRLTGVYLLLAITKRQLSSGDLEFLIRQLNENDVIRK